MKILEVALVNASLSMDEFRVLDHLRTAFGINQEENEKIREDLEGIIKEKYDDPNVIEKVYDILKAQKLQAFYQQSTATCTV